MLLSDSIAIILFDSGLQEKACKQAWDLLTGKYGLNSSRLYVTYFGGDCVLGLEPDLETRDIWRHIG
jgi:alanyl-tRNA synthetase